MSERPVTDAVVLEEVHLTLGRPPLSVDVLRGVDLKVDAATSVGITGASGSGKSSLLMVIAGLERPSRGRVVVAGEDLTRKDEDELTVFRGRKVGVVFQAFHLIPTMTALENVAVPLELAGVDDAIDRAHAELRAVGLADRARHFPAALSGGEQQRVAIARALAPKPILLLADEPTGNLDEATGQAVIDLMFAAQAERGQTMVLVTHDAALAARCGRVVRVVGGRIADAHRGEARS